MDAQPEPETEPAAPSAGEATWPPPPAYGQFAPDFVAASDHSPRFRFNTAAGRWIVLLLFGSGGAPASAHALQAALGRRQLFDDDNAAFFGVSVDPADRSERGLRNEPPGVRFFWDFDRGVSLAYGAAAAGRQEYRPIVLLLDRFQRVAALEPAHRMHALLDILVASLAEERASVEPPAPVLTIPRVFEPGLCRVLMDHYDRRGGQASGFMQEVDGLTVGRHDSAKKRRKDVEIEDEELRAATRVRLQRRLAPAIERAFVWKATRIERYIVACYEAADGGFFFPHRDNTTAGTAHRQFAVSLNLNDDYDGGELRFPEFGRRTYKPPPGGATVFSCSLLHEATPVTRGVRYAFLPFLYDDEAARVRVANLDRIKSSAPE